MGTASRPLAVVTGASSGIGLELAKLCAQNGFDLLIAADEPTIKPVGRILEAHGGQVETLEANLAELEGVESLYAAIAGRPVAALLANAVVGSGQAFLDQSFDDILRVVDTNVTGTLYLIHKVARHLRARGAGRILVTGSLASSMPGPYQAVYGGTKAMLESFSLALGAELEGSGVTVTCLMPGGNPNQAPAEVARSGFEAMMRGDGDAFAGWKSGLRKAATPELIAEHQRAAEPRRGSRG